MHTTGAPWLTLGRHLMCSPSITEIKTQMHVQTRFVCTKRTEQNCESSNLAQGALSGEMKYTHIYIKHTINKINTHCLTYRPAPNMNT